MRSSCSLGFNDFQFGHIENSTEIFFFLPFLAGASHTERNFVVLSLFFFSIGWNKNIDDGMRVRDESEKLSARTCVYRKYTRNVFCYCCFCFYLLVFDSVGRCHCVLGWLLFLLLSLLCDL